MNNKERLDQYTCEHLPQAIALLDSEEWLQIFPKFVRPSEREAIQMLRLAISTVLTAISTQSGPQPDPITGLAPCGCGGVVEQEDFHDGFFPCSRVTCRGCWTETTRCRCTTKEAHEMARIGWNTSHGYTAPPRPGAIVPGAGEMAPNGDEGASE